ncbi:hypothetical protein PPERSA_10881 [Pseudocohnilembus persalinus]|uniref:Uncharacterized protein n=1 Tax=Pseudocohnilembus persalinus TaxID=266149 RepID=A0A0V0R6V3_PSEPJ|nr:hypothetical protein PPERSA_10881 [Pseudocohnilembus persalinus]|eukprot:KRX10215.1 hypothetical protein PPERSA_10881 [Pseudocohnilembus persalinus]
MLNTIYLKYLNQNQLSKINYIFYEIKIINKIIKIKFQKTQSPCLKPLQDKSIFDDDEPIEQNQKPLENLPDHQKQQQQKEENQEENQQQQEESKENVKNVQNGQNASLQKKKIDFDLEKNLIFSLKSMTKAIKLSENKVQTIPAMVSLETAKEAQQLDLNQRPSLDLVCVIDRQNYACLV